MEFHRTSSLACHAGSFFFPFSFDVKVFVKKRKKALCAPRTYRAFGRNASENQNTSFIFSLFVVTVTVTHPASYGTPLLFLLSYLGSQSVATAGCL